MDFVADQLCFACGRDNPIGLHLSFHQEDHTYVTVFTADAAHQGYQGIVHGGIIATLLDEIMARYVWSLHGPSATAHLDIRYRRPAPTGQPLHVRGWLTATRRGGRAFECAATVCLANGTLLAEATALLLRTSPPTTGG